MGIAQLSEPVSRSSDGAIRVWDLATGISAHPMDSDIDSNLVPIDIRPYDLPSLRALLSQLDNQG